MKYAIILAGGTGTRMGNKGIPKQFLTIKDKPIIIHTVQTVSSYKLLDKIIIACNENYIQYLKDLLSEFDMLNMVEITLGGKDRLGSVLNGIKYIEKTYGIKDNDIILAHDSVRMFVSRRIIDENLKMAEIYGAATTVYPVEETIVQSNKDNMLYRAFSRDKLFSGQSPQTFNIKRFMNNTNKISEEQLNQFTDLSENMFFNNDTVYPIIGEKDNIKITRPFDLIVAEALLNQKSLDKKNE